MLAALLTLVVVVDGFVIAPTRTKRSFDESLLLTRFHLSRQGFNGGDEKKSPIPLPEENKVQPSDRNIRRELFRTVAAATTVGATTSTNAAVPGLLLDLPMIRLKLPSNALGEDYVAVQLCLPGQTTPVDFMLDTGLTLEMVTPHLQKDILKISGGKRSGLRGLAAGGTTNTDLVTISGASLCDPETAQNLPLSELHATVQDFPQEHIDPKHDPVEGMLGQELLSQYDVDLDFRAGRVRLYQPGTATTNAMVEIPATVINETGLLGFRLRRSSTGPTQNQQQQPIIAFIDCGSPFSAINWQAAAYLGLPTNQQDDAYKQGPAIVATGIDGRPMQLPTIEVPFTFAGNAKTDSSTATKIVDFESPPSSWKPWKPVRVAVGDLPVFPQLLGDGIRPHTGPAALIGLDVLAQRRVIIESAGPNARTRRRRIFVSSPN